VKAELAAQELHDQEVQRMIAVVAALRADLNSGRVVRDNGQTSCVSTMDMCFYFLSKTLFSFQNLPHVSAAFRDTDEDIQKAKDASGLQ